MNPLSFCSYEMEYTLHCHHFNHFRIDLTNSLKSGIDNFKSLPDKDKKYILLYGDTCLDRTKKKKKFLEATLAYIKIPRDSVGHFLNKNLTSQRYYHT